jgi:hypothetical protein
MGNWYASFKGKLFEVGWVLGMPAKREGYATEGKVCLLQRDGYASYRWKGMPATEGRLCQLQREGNAS